MILVDLQQIAIANLMVESKGKPVFQPDLVRHMILNMLRGFRVKFKDRYGELVLCSDSGKYWRKDYFPFYKAKRKEKRDTAQTEGTFDWQEFFTFWNHLREEIREVFPYKMMYVNNCEADDIIAVLAKHLNQEKTLIISGDHDFQQLQKYPNVSQYAPTQRKMVKCVHPAAFLKEHIIRGDVGDGIPNFLSVDDVFVTEGKRQTPIRQSKVDLWLTLDPKDFCNDAMSARWDRNRTLVDFEFIPTEIQNSILEEYKTPIKGSRKSLFTYFAKHRMRLLMESLSEF